MVGKSDIVRRLATMPDGSVLDHVLFEHGTAMFLKRQSDDAALNAATAICGQIGDHGGVGSRFGDFRAAKLKDYEAWLVTFCWGPSLMTVVLPEDIGGALSVAPADWIVAMGTREFAEVGLCGRLARNKDMRERKIVHRSWVAAE